MSQELKVWSRLQPKTNLRYLVSQGGGASILPSRLTTTQCFVRRLNGNLWKRRLCHGWGRSLCCLKCFARTPRRLSNAVRPFSSKCALCVIAPSVKLDAFRPLHANILTLHWQGWPSCWSKAAFQWRYLLSSQYDYLHFTDTKTEYWVILSKCTKPNSVTIRTDIPVLMLRYQHNFSI